MKKAYLIASSCLLLFATQASGEVTVFGPTPYRSAADSPFAKHLGGPNFYLEDFEDGELNTPGISVDRVNPTLIMPPGEFTDSVDIDDGVLDGFGNAGYSLASNNLAQGLSDPITNQMLMIFEFSAADNDRLPNVFGFVLTDSPLASNTWNGVTLSAIATDDMGNRIAGVGGRIGEDSSRAGESQDDLFYGFKSDVSIAELRILVGFRANSLPPDDSFSFEIDHVQYGVVPEPSAAWLLGLGLLALAAKRGK